MAILLEAIAPRVLPLDKSVVMSEIPTAVLDSLFERDIKFSDKVRIIKSYLRQPLRTALVAKVPTLEREVEKFPAKIFRAIELFYTLRCIAAVFPDSGNLVKSVSEALITTPDEKLTSSHIKRATEALTQLRGMDAAISAVASAASKIFYTVDGMAFDDFAVSLNVIE